MEEGQRKSNILSNSLLYSAQVLQVITCSVYSFCVPAKQSGLKLKVQYGFQCRPTPMIIVKLHQLDVNFWKINNVFRASNKQTVY